MRKQVLCALLAVLLLAGCGRNPEPAEAATFAMDTMMNFTLYGEKGDAVQDVLDKLTGLIGSLDNVLSATREDSDIFRVNQSGGQPVKVCGWTSSLLDGALKLCEVTDGALDITAYPAVKAWGFTAEEHRVPSEHELAALAAGIDYTAVRLEENTITLPAGMEMDLGAVAKGYAGDLLAEYVRENGVTSALLNLGQSTIAAIGSKPGEKPWRVAIQDPAGGEPIGVVELEDVSIGTSGGYQRFFEQDGVTYWHILDPRTAAPARSGLASVTVLSPSALTCDGLSTALFVMGLERGTQFWRDHPELEFEALFVADGGKIYCTKGLAERFTPANRKVVILE